MSGLKIDPEALRRRCHDIPDCTEILLPTADDTTGASSQQQKYVVSFVVGEQSHKLEGLARVTVFCETGTVAIARVFRGTVRQLFRRNVSSLDVIERLMRTPPHLTPIDSTLIDLNDDDNKTNSLQKGGDDEASSAVAFAKSVRTNVELIHVGVAILQGEHEKLVQHLASVEQQPPAVQTTPSNSSSHNNYDPSETSTCADEPQGMEFQFSLPEQPMKQVDKCLNDIASMGRLIRSVSTNGKGAVFLYGNGGVAFTPHIPRALHLRLSKLRQTSDRDSRPAYVSLGTRDRFYMAFHDGSFCLKGPKTLERELKLNQTNNLLLRPLSVAFGIPFDAYFIVFEDGSWSFQGKGIPQALKDKLATRQDRPDLVCVNLGTSVCVCVLLV
jgi:hypothetical protein